MTSLANLIYAQTLYKYAVDNSVGTIPVLPDISQTVAEYIATQLPKHPLLTGNQKTTVLTTIGGEGNVSAKQCQKWWRQMYSATKMDETELVMDSLAKLVDLFRDTYTKDAITALQTDETRYNQLNEAMEREEKAQKAKLDKERAERIEQAKRLKEEKEKALKEKEDKEREEKEKAKKEAAQAAAEANITTEEEPKLVKAESPDADDVKMVDAPLEEEIAEAQEVNAGDSAAEKSESPTPATVQDSIKSNTELESEAQPEPVEEEEEEGEAKPEESTESKEEVDGEKEEVDTDRGVTEDPEESEPDRVSETPEAATPGSEERTRKRARSTTEEADTRKRSRRNTSAAPSANRKFQTVAANLLSNISSNKSASFFVHPVNPNGAPNYYDLIFSPTDLRTIKASVKDGRISSNSELERELAKMFANAIMYNPWDSDVNVWAREMQQETDALLTLFRGAGGE